MGRISFDNLQGRHAVLALRAFSTFPFLASERDPGTSLGLAYLMEIGAAVITNSEIIVVYDLITLPTFFVVVVLGLRILDQTFCKGW